MSAAQVTWGLTSRSLMLIPRIISTFIPSLVFPIFLLIAFAGAFSGLVDLPGFPAESSIDWFVPMTTLQGAMFAGITTGLGLARDLESGFFDRFLLSPTSRAALVAGPLLASMLRAFIPFTVMLLVAAIGGAHFHGGIAGILMLLVACLGIALAMGGWAVGIALRIKTMQAAPLMQVVVFLLVFLSTAQMPLDLLSGWLHTVARFNPMTQVLALARQGFLGSVSWADTWPGLLALAGLCLLFVGFAYRGIRRIIP